MEENKNVKVPECLIEETADGNEVGTGITDTIETEAPEIESAENRTEEVQAEEIELEGTEPEKTEPEETESEEAESEETESEGTEPEETESEETEPEEAESEGTEPEETESEETESEETESEGTEPEEAESEETEPEGTESEGTESEETKSEEAESEGTESEEAESEGTEPEGAESEEPETSEEEGSGENADEAGEVNAGDAETEEKAKTEEKAETETEAASPAATDNSAIAGSGVTEGKKSKASIGIMIGRIFLGLVTTAAVGAAAYYGYGAYYYSNHYYQGTTIVVKSADGSQDCQTEDISYMTVEEAQELVSGFANDYVLTVSSIKNTTDSLTSADIDYKVTQASIDSLQETMDSQDNYSWIMHMTDIAVATVEKTLEMETEYDEAKLKELIDSMVCVSPKVVDNGTDAYLTYNEEEVAYEIIDAVPGNVGIEENISEKIFDAIDTNNDHVELVEEDYYQPEIQADDQTLVAKRDEINNYLNACITVSDHGSTIVVDRNIIITFLDIDEEWNVSLNEDKMADYVNKNFDPAFDTINTERTVNLKNSGKVTMSYGTFGSLVKTVDEVALLKEEISGGIVTERKPCYYNNYEQDSNGGIGDTYIDIDLSKQKVYVVVNGKTEITTDCVTGLTNGTRDTPTGFYYVFWKTTNYTMVKYNAFVYYWMPFDNTGVGLHDATWRSSFGGNIYKSNGSHGCINLPKAMAAKIYEVAYVGIPVIVHK